MGKGDAEILQIGPGNVLTGLVRTIQKEAEPLTVQEDEASSEIEDVHPIPLEELTEKSDAVTEEVFYKENGRKEAELSKKIPMADDLCVESDSGGRTDHGVVFALIPAIRRLRDEKMKKLGYAKMIRIGAAGGIGTPDAAAAMFVMGCDFILTGSINQCTVEAATSDAVKDLLQQANVQDTEYAPSMEMFEFGAKMQVLKRSLFFPARANKLYELYRHYDSIEEIDRKTKTQIQEMYFRKSFDQVYEECKKYQSSLEIERAGRNPKYKMAMIFKWYFRYASELAINGNSGQKVDYMIYCGPAMGAFNQWVKGTRFEDWRKRHVDEIGIMIVEEAAKLLSQRLDSIAK